MDIVVLMISKESANIARRYGQQYYKMLPVFVTPQGGYTRVSVGYELTRDENSYQYFIAKRAQNYTITRMNYV